MEKKLLALVFVALLGGLGGGYGLGYVFYQPQIQNLQSDFDNLGVRFDEFENRTWHEVYSIYASSDITTGKIQFIGSSVRVMWIATGSDSGAWVSFQLHFYNGTPYGVWSSSGLKTATSDALELPESGDYYLQITTHNTYYYVSVWDFY